MSTAVQVVSRSHCLYVKEVEIFNIESMVEANAEITQFEEEGNSFFSQCLLSVDLQ